MLRSIYTEHARHMLAQAASLGAILWYCEALRQQLSYRTGALSGHGRQQAHTWSVPGGGQWDNAIAHRVAALGRPQAGNPVQAGRYPARAARVCNTLGCELTRWHYPRLQSRSIMMRHAPQVHGRETMRLLSTHACAIAALYGRASGRTVHLCRSLQTQTWQQAPLLCHHCSLHTQVRGVSVVIPTRT